MDLADVWGQHKKFILAIAGALLLLLIGRGVIRSTWNYESTVAQGAAVAGGMKKQVDVPAAALETLRADVDDLRSRYAELTRAMRRQPAAGFTLAAGEANPRELYFRRQREMQKGLANAAEKQDIRLPPNLGLKAMAPTEPEEIRRALLALDVVQQVVVEAIGAGVRRVETIQVEEAARARASSSAFVSELRVHFEIVGGERSIRALVAGLVDGPARGATSFLALDNARLKPVKGEPGLLQLTLAATALEIATSDEEGS